MGWGLDEADDTLLRAHFTGDMSALAETDAVALDRVDLILDGTRNAGMPLRAFYAPRRAEARMLSPMTAAGYASPIAIEEYALTTGRNPPPSGDGDATLKWLSDGASGQLYFDWLRQLDESVAAGRASAREAKALSRIHDTVLADLKEAIKQYQGAKGFLEREERRRQPELEDEKRDAERAMSPPSPPQKRTHRKYGELPPEPEIVVRRPKRES